MLKNPYTKKVMVVAKPLVKHLGTVTLQKVRMVFDDSTYPGKYVFELSDIQLKRLQEIEGLFKSDYPPTTSCAWSTNEYGSQLRINGPPGMEKATYNLVIKLSNWNFRKESGFKYSITDSNITEALPFEKKMREELISLGEL